MTHDSGMATIRKTPEDLASVVRALWAIELPEEPLERPRLPVEIVTGGRDTYEACRVEAQRLREAGANGFVCPSAALQAKAARGWRVRGGFEPGPSRDGQVIVLFDPRPDLVGWAATRDGRPDPDLLSRVRHF